MDCWFWIISEHSVFYLTGVHERRNYRSFSQCVKTRSIQRGRIFHNYSFEQNVWQLQTKILLFMSTMRFQLFLSMG